MAGKLTDFNQLSKKYIRSVETVGPVEKPTPKPSVSSTDARILESCTSKEDLFAQLLGGPRVQPPAKPTPPVATPPASSSAKPEPPPLPEVRTVTVIQSDPADTTRIATLERENAVLREALQRATTPPPAPVVETPSPIVTPSPTPLNVKKQTLNLGDAHDLFEGEVVEHVLEVLKEAREQCAASGRLRRAEILDAVLAGNPLKGALHARRQALKAIMSTCVKPGTKEIRDLGELGFMYITGKNHYKFKMGNFMVTLSKTPSDHRSNANIIAEMRSRFF